jgi:hypothetical protein
MRTVVETMIEWIAPLRSIVKSLRGITKYAMALGAGWNSLADKRGETQARVDLASLRFDSTGISAILKKVSDRKATEKDFEKLWIMLGETLDDVEQILDKLSYEQSYGARLLINAGFDVAAEFQDKVRKLKIEIRERLSHLLNDGVGSENAATEAHEVEELIGEFNKELARLHKEAFPTKPSRSAKVDKASKQSRVKRRAVK